MIQNLFLFLCLLLSAPTCVNAAASAEPRAQQQIVACAACTSMHKAVDQEHLQCIRALAIHDRNTLNTPDSSGMPPLLYAVALNRPQCVNRLLWDGALVTAADPDGKTALHWAAQKSNNACLQEIIKFLQHTPQQIDLGAFFNAQDMHGQTALHYATEGGNQVFSTTLLTSPGIDVTVKDERGKTPLHEAVSWADSTTITALIEHGANPHEPDNTGKTPIQIARENPYRSNPEQLIETLETTVPDVTRPTRRATPQKPPVNPQPPQDQPNNTEESREPEITSEQQETLTPPKTESTAPMYASGAFFLGLVILAFESSEAYNKAADKLIAEKQKVLDENREKQTEADDLDKDPSYSFAEVLSCMWQSFKQKSWSKKKAWITGATLTLGGLGTWATLKIKG